MRFFLLAALLVPTARAGTVELVPALSAAPQISAPLAPAGLNPLAAAPSLVSAAPSLSPALLPAAAPALAAAVLPAAAHPTTPREEAAAIVRRLLDPARRREETLAQSFDGGQAAPLFPDVPAVGATVDTRHGEYTLVSSEIRDEGFRTAGIYEHWTGPAGTVWVLRQHGPDRWDVYEWHREKMPRAFGGDDKSVSSTYNANFSIDDGIVSANVDTAPEGEKRRGSTFINAKQTFRDALAWFGPRVTGIKGVWAYGTNLDDFNRFTALGLSYEEAAALTWTGERAGEAGFTRATFRDEQRAKLDRRARGDYHSVAVVFVKPPAPVFPGAPAVGETVATRHGPYTLASSMTKDEGGGKIAVFERWTGPAGDTLWFLRRRGPAVWEQREWRGRHMPIGFGPEGVELPPSYMADFSLAEGGRVISTVETTSERSRRPSTMVNAKQAFRDALTWFGPAATSIEGIWAYGTNLAEYDRLTKEERLSPQKAAALTWTGRRAAEAGFTKVQRVEYASLPHPEKNDYYDTVHALFVRP